MAGLSFLTRISTRGSKSFSYGKQLKGSLFWNRQAAPIWQRNGLDLTRKLHKDYRLVYEGPLSNTVKYIKTFSLATCIATLIGTPILVIYGKEKVPKAGKIAVGATVLLIGTSTTFILHWFTRVYVHRMFYNPLSSSFAVETMNIVARRRTTHFPVDHIQYPLSERAFSTFSAEGKSYFLHMELKEAELAMGYVKERNVSEMQKSDI